MTHYTSLEQIADEFLRRAKDSNAASERTPTAKHKAYHRAQAVVWETAADLLRNTRLSDPAMEAMREALLGVVAATRAYLPPDGIDAQECISRILAATDNPEINPIILEAENAS